MKYILFLLLCLGLTTNIEAQVKLSGKITDKTKRDVLSNVTIQLLNKKDSTKYAAKTNDNGEYSFDKLTVGTYTVNSTLLGFKPYLAEVQLTDRPVQLSFEMEPGEIMIEEIAITAAPMVAVKGDTMEYNAKNFVTREFADADEMVAQVPGVTIDEDGNVKAHGEDVKRILVDGKEFFSTDPRIALKNLPADIIDKLQIIDEKSEQARFSGFDDGKRSKVINIVTKPDKRKGYFGRANAGKGDSDKFALSTALNSFNGDQRISMTLMANNINETSLGEQGRGGGRRGNNNTERGLADTYAGAANYSNSFLDKKLEVNGNYNFRYSNTFTNTLSDIEYLAGARANQFQNSHQLATAINNEHTFGGRVKWQIDSMNNLDFTPNLTFRGTGRDNSSSSQMTKNQTELINKSDRKNNNDNNSLNYGGSLSYMHRFRKSGQTISLNASGNKSSNDALGQTLAFVDYYKNAVLDRIDTNDRQNVTNGYGSGFNGKISFTQNLNKFSRLQANYGLRNTNNYSDRKTLEFLAETGQYEELNARLSNEFRNDFTHQSAGLSYSYNKRDTLRIQVGLDYEHGVRVNDRTVPYDLRTVADFGSFLPNFTAVYFFNKERNVEFNYNTNTNVPSIDQLQDYIDNGNELNIRRGNPDLKQEYRHDLRFQYRDVNKVNGRSFTSNASVSFYKNRIVDNRFITDTTLQLFDDVILGAGGSYTVPTNISGQYDIRSTTSYGLPLKKLGFNISLNTNLYLNKNFTYLNDELTPNYGYGVSQQVGMNTTFSRKVIVGFHYNYSTRFSDNPTARVTHYRVTDHRLSNTLVLEFWKNMIFSSQYSYIYNGGIMNSGGNNISLLNASLGYKMLKRKNAEISIKGFDLLNNATNINRNVTGSSINNIQSNTLNRYFLLSLTYNLRSFGGRSGNNSERSMDGPRGGRSEGRGEGSRSGGSGGFGGGRNRN